MTPAHRNTLVTGGTKGIGRAIALRLAREGHRVVCVYRSDERGRSETLEAAHAQGVELFFDRVDVESAEEVSALFSRLAADDREPDFLINAAGMTRDRPFAFTSLEDFDAVVSGNLRSTFLMCQQACKTMARRRFGRIVNFASPAALVGNEGQVAYAAAKAGVLGLTRSLARELARYQITVNAVSPGLIPTAMTAVLSKEKMESMVRKIPLGRTGTPEEVAGAVQMLCHALGGYLTGQCIAVDGGLT